jgi:ribosomal protein S18 acetylase RimI-like enzyme
MSRIKYERLSFPCSDAKSDAIWAVHKKSFPNRNFSKSGFKSNLKKDAICIVAYLDGKTIGYALGKGSGSKQDALVVRFLAVDSEYRKKGIGTKLIRKLFRETLKNPKFKKVYLHFRGAKGLDYFYQKLGFGSHRKIGKYSNGEEKYKVEISRQEIIKFL